MEGPLMSIVCAWCGRDMGEKMGPDGAVTHGICIPCMKAELEKLWQTDPRQAVQTEIMLAAQWQDNINAQVDGEAEQLAGKYADFNDYRNTAMRYVRALPLDQRARQGIVERQDRKHNFL